jgi:hypothetical protein
MDVPAAEDEVAKRPRRAVAADEVRRAAGDRPGEREGPQQIEQGVLAQGAAAVALDRHLDRLAERLRAGVALTVDESALLLKLDDVYWTEEGIVSVQLGFAALAAMSAVALAVRVLRRGEAAVLDGDEG